MTHVMPTVSVKDSDGGSPSRDSFIRPDWPAPALVRALITTRHDGASAAPFDGFNLGTHVGDDPGAVQSNRMRLRQHLPAEPRWMEQVHGVQCLQLGSAAPAPASQSALPQGDAAVTRDAGVVCAVLSADCLPVLLCARDGSAVGVAHAGWRGLAGGVIESALQGLCALGTPATQVMAWLGPAISGARFEVGAEVRAAFLDHSGEDAGAFVQHRPQDATQSSTTQPGGEKYLANLYALARARLRRAGVAQVYGGGFCTYMDRQRFFSYRRDGRTGRMASLIWLAPAAGHNRAQSS
jgi:YfiH family protein